MSGWIRGVVLRACLSTLAAVWSQSAHADDGALAEALFREAQSLMAQSKYDDACPKFEESERLDPSTGTLLNLAVCHEKVGKLASAWNEFHAAVAAARRDQRADRVTFAEEHIADLEPRLSRLTIELPQASDAPGIEIRLDHTILGRPALGLAFPVDAGTHELAVRAPGKVSWTKRLTIVSGPSAQSVTIPRLRDLAQQPTPSASTEAPEPSATRDQGVERGAAQRIVAYALGGAGVVGLGIGTGFGIDALVKFGQSNKQGCDESDCDTQGATLRDAARKSGDISTVAFIAGGVLLASGIVVYFTAPRRSAAAHARERAPNYRAQRARGNWQAQLNSVPGGGRLNVETRW